MHAYIINLDGATDRWESVSEAFAGTKLIVRRVSAVNGATLHLPMEEYDERRYRRRHGRPTSRGHVGCYLSHVRAMEMFLETDETHALIVEDDVTLGADFEEVLAGAMSQTKRWNVLRLTGLAVGKPAKIVPLTTNYALCVGFGRSKGTGAYVIDRKAAQAWATGLLPMWLPIDHALDREWIFGLRTVTVAPFPASQTDAGFRSSIQVGQSRKLARWRRYCGTYPYQVINESVRWCWRSWQYLRASRA